LPILPGLLKYEDILNGEINHAMRVTFENAAYAYVHPASHFGPSDNTDDTYPIYGSRFRLKSSFPETGYSAQGTLFVQALKKYGIIFADQGTGSFVTGVTDSNWEDDFFDEINQPANPPEDSPQMRIHMSNFEMVQSPNDVVYGCNASPSCNSQTSNSEAFVPTNYNQCSSKSTPLTTGDASTTSSTSGVSLASSVAPSASSFFVAAVLIRMALL